MVSRYEIIKDDYIVKGIVSRQKYDLVVRQINNAILEVVSGMAGLRAEEESSKGKAQLENNNSKNFETALEATLITAFFKPRKKNVVVNSKKTLPLPTIY